MVELCCRVFVLEIKEHSEEVVTHEWIQDFYVDTEPE